MATGASSTSKHADFPNLRVTPPTQSAPKPPPILHGQGQTLEAVKDITFGSTAGIIGKYVEYPFDTVKVRLQSRSNWAAGGGSSRLHGPLDAFAEAFRAPEGPLRNLYRGISAPLFGAAIETSSLFFSYRIAQELMLMTAPNLRSPGSTHADTSPRSSLSLSALLVCGAASGAFTSLLLTPIELIKCKMQIFRSQGLLGFWHGQLGTLIRETGGSAAWFGSYEGIKLAFERHNGQASSSTTSTTTTTTTVPQRLFAGALAGISYNFFFYPADTIKSRMQTEQASSGGVGIESRPTGFLNTARQLYTEQGWHGFYRGCGITVFRAAPSSAIIFGIYEGLRGWF